MARQERTLEGNCLALAAEKNDASAKDRDVQMIVLYPMQDYYTVLKCQPGVGTSFESFTSSNLLKKSNFSQLNHGTVILQEELRTLGLETHEDVRRWLIVRDRDLIAIVRINFFYYIAKAFFMRIVHQNILLAKASFRLEARRFLIERLSQPDANLKDYIDAYCRYTFFDEYSLWIHNSTSNVFTCMASSRKPHRDYIGVDEGKSINDILECDYKNESRGLIDSEFSQFEEAGMKSLVRIKIKLGPSKETAALTFYSSNEAWNIQPETQKDIVNQISLKYLEQIQGQETALDAINNYLLRFEDSYKKEDFLSGFVENICTLMRFESASIFLLDDSENNLILESTKDLETNGKPTKEIIYSLTEKCPTVDAFTKKTIICIYDLENTDTSGIYSEKTDNPGKNWIAFPITASNRIIGILRVKNKYNTRDGSKHVIAPRPIDFSGIAAATLHLGQYLDTKNQLSKLSEMLNKQENFNKVFLHEVISPIQKFNNAPKAVELMLSKRPVSDETFDKCYKQMEDIFTMGQRLKFLVDVYDFESIVSRSSENNQLSLLHHLIYPIKNVTQQYCEQMYGAIFVIDHDSMHQRKIFGDQILYNMVLNSLIDNAAKYFSVQGNKIISIHAKPNNEYLDLYVESDGIEILKSETVDIFNNGFRGSKVQNQKIHGTGIGLHLSKRIMVEQGGDMILINRHSPVIFCMRIRISD